MGTCLLGEFKPAFNTTFIARVLLTRSNNVFSCTLLNPWGKNRICSWERFAFFIAEKHLRLILHTKTKLN